MFEKKMMEKLTLYTGSNGKKGCTCNCVGCSQEAYGQNNPYYQGTKKQVVEIVEAMPKLKDCIILGNPDPSVDPEFCNWVAKYMISRGVRVRFSSSGYNAINTVKILLNGLDTNYIDYMSYSIDSIDEQLLEKMKGKNISLKIVDEAIEYCNEIGVRTKIQPTLWKINKDNYEELVRYYISRGVEWFSFHVGSVETFSREKKLLKHLEPYEWRKIFKHLIKLSAELDFSIHMPYLVTNDEEYKKYIESMGKKCYPDELKNSQIWLEKSQLRTTHCPLLRETRAFEYNFKDNNFKMLDVSVSEEGFCPATSKCMGKEICDKSIDGLGNEFMINGEKYHTVCRFYNYKYNLPV